MILALLAFFAALLAGLLTLAIVYRGRAVAAKNSAMILARVMPSSGQVDRLYARGIAPTRLATSERLQLLLRDAPMVTPMANLLDQAGVPTTVAQLTASMFVCSIGGSILASALGCVLPAATVVGVAGFVLPILYHKRLRTKRVAAFEAQLPQVLEMLTLYLRSGRSLPQAFVAMATEAQAPASEEFAICAEEYRLGRPLPQALRGLSMKYQESLGLKLFSIAVTVLGQTGGNLVEVLDRIRRTLESSITYVLKLRSLTGDARNSASLLGATPALFLMLIALGNPPYFNQFFETTFGMGLFGAFIVLWVSGLAWVKILMSSKA